jgi:hypothetical protein
MVKRAHRISISKGKPRSPLGNLDHFGSIKEGRNLNDLRGRFHGNFTFYLGKGLRAPEKHPFVEA